MAEVRLKTWDVNSTYCGPGGNRPLCSDSRPRLLLGLGV